MGRVTPVGRPRPGPGRPSRSAGADRIQDAIDNGEMFLVYQPEVDLRTGAVVAVEALVRWQDPHRGEVAPEQFISLAEESDLIVALGTWIVGESLRNYAQWLGLQPELAITLRVNFSPNQLADPGLVDMIESALTGHGVPGDRLCIEITENFQVEDVDGISASLEKLHQLGVTSALDDLGSGYSSLGRLRALRTEIMKIDRTLVADIDVDPRAQAIVAMLVGLATELGMEIIVEGVERDSEARTLRELGCRRAQGHLFGRPMDAASMQQVLIGRRPLPGGAPGIS